ncbi:unnamed protein product, partial [Meganyctiphanes norvegica]
YIYKFIYIYIYVCVCVCVYVCMCVKKTDMCKISMTCISYFTSKQELWVEREHLTLWSPHRLTQTTQIREALGGNKPIRILGNLWIIGVLHHIYIYQYNTTYMNEISN